MKISGFYDESISNGLGWRAVLFVSGCPHHCKGCHNSITWDFNYGEDFNQEEIINKIVNNSILKGVTISGGEPLCKENIKAVLEFIKKIKELKPNFNIWCYSGYTFEELKARNDKITNEILNTIDVLVDGKFILAKKDPKIKFRGSSNQRVIDVKETLKQGRIIRVDLGEQELVTN